MDGIEIADLVKKARAGDKEALIQLVMDRKDEYYRLAYVYMTNKDDALDAVQDMIITLYDNIRKLREPELFYSWSRTILVNHCKKLLKKRSRMIPEAELVESGYHEAFDGLEQRHDLAMKLQALSSEQQEAIRLKYYMGMDYASIAHMIKVPEGTVKSRVSIGLKKLREAFGVQR